MPRESARLQRALQSPDDVSECVAILDDDPAVRRLLERMLGSLGIEVKSFGSAREFLRDESTRERCACLVLDVRLPDLSGVEVHRQLRATARPPAIVFISGHADVPMAVDAMRSGAFDFLQKPFREQQLLDSVQRALLTWRASQDEANERALVANRRKKLTPRENEVLQTLLRGMRAKEIGVALGISTKTAEEHRANIMHKMHVSSVAALIALFPAAS